MKTVNVKYKRWFNKEFQELDEKYKENIRQFIRKKIEEVMNI
jgi:mRNA-degrading endonuclease RelE of RelBE toxin-antitoxin system